MIFSIAEKDESVMIVYNHLINGKMSFLIIGIAAYDGIMSCLGFHVGNVLLWTVITNVIKKAYRDTTSSVTIKSVTAFGPNAVPFLTTRVLYLKKVNDYA